jgi:ATP-binding cassette, subfamily C, type I secretion system permease/ATPase
VGFTVVFVSHGKSVEWIVSSVKKNKLAQALGSMRGAFLIVAVFSLFINLAVLTVPIYMLQIYDRVLTSMSTDTLIMLSLLAAGLLIMMAIVDVARSRLLVRIGARLDARLSTALFRASLDTPAGQKPITAGQPLRDLGTVRTFLTGAGILALFDAPWTPLYLAIIFLFSPLLGTIALLGASIILMLAIAGEFAARGPLKAGGAESRQAADYVESVARNAEAVTSMGMIDNLESRWLDSHETSIAYQSTASDRVAVINSVAKAIRFLLQVAILGFGAWLCLQQAITPGVMIAASIIMGRALAPVQAAIGGWRGVIEARAAYRRLEVTLQQQGEETRSTKLVPSTGRLVVDKVVMRFPGHAEPVLKQVSLQLESGESLGLIGPSGSGKSTLARLLIGYWPPVMGSVRLDGAEISAWPKSDVGPYLGYMPQDVELLDGTVAENIERFGPADDTEVVNAATVAGVKDVILGLPNGFDTRIGHGGYVLSGGQRQCIALARAVYKTPPLIVLDEPNANLDADGESALRNCLITLRERNCTVVVISHKPSLLASVDHLLMLRDGQVMLFGPRDKIMAKLPRPASGRVSNEGTQATKPERSADQGTGSYAA